MKYVKDGKIVLNGTYRQAELEERIFRAFELINEKEVDLFLLHRVDDEETYNDSVHHETMLTKKEFYFLKGMCK